MTPTPNTLDLDRLAEAAKVATPGPWSFNGNCHNGVWSLAERCYIVDAGCAADASHIASFDPPTVLTLIARAREADKLRAELEAIRAERDNLASKVYVPGLWKCAKCGFQLMQRVLRASDGAVGIRDKAGETCPNDGAPLWRVSERDAGNEMVDRCEEQMARARAAESDLAAQSALLKQAAKALEQIGSDQLIGFTSNQEMRAIARDALAAITAAMKGEKT